MTQEFTTREKAIMQTVKLDVINRMIKLTDKVGNLEKKHLQIMKKKFEDMFEEELSKDKNLMSEMTRLLFGNGVNK